MSEEQRSDFAKAHGLAILWPSNGGTTIKPERIIGDMAAEKISAALQPGSRHLVRDLGD
jgi:hypothetical protein